MVVMKRKGGLYIFLLLERAYKAKYTQSKRAEAGGKEQD